MIFISSFPPVVAGASNLDVQKDVGSIPPYESQEWDGWEDSEFNETFFPEDFRRDMGTEEPYIPQLGPQLVTEETAVDGQQEINMQRMMARMSNEIPDPSIINAVGNLNVKTPQAPYSIAQQQESISTLNGNLTVETTDISLPGRNGLSFDLKRIYDASSAEFFKQDYEMTKFCVCRVEHSGIKYLEKKNIHTEETSKNVVSSGRFYFDPYIRPDIMNNVFDAFGLMRYINAMAGKGTAFANDWSSPDANGIQSRYIWEVSSYPQVTFNDLYTGPLLINWRNKAKEKTSEERLYPIGKGWMWNIPFIKYAEGKSYLNMMDQGSYEISGARLKGYAFQDLSIASDTSVTVNGKQSYLALKSIHGLHHYFASDGRLIQIADRYNNTISFYYNNHTTYGTVLTRIIDAANNSIEITYNENEVELKQGDKTVKYYKWKYESYDPLPEFDLLETEILYSVSDAAGRRTYYNYAFENASFNLIQGAEYQNNMTALLKDIQHPTGAITNYTYAPVTRKTGDYASQRAFRITSRKDMANGNTYRLQNYTYTNPQGAATDYASTYGQNIANFYVNVDDSLTRTVYDHRKKVSNANDSPEFYTNRVTQTVGDEQRIATFQYDEVRKITSPIQTTTQYKKGTSTAAAVQTSRTFDNYGNILTETDPTGNITTYTYHPTTRLLSSVMNRVNDEENRLTEFIRNPQGSIIKITVRKNNENGELMAQASYENIDVHGNVRRIVIKDDGRDIIYDTEYGAAFLGAYPTKQTIRTTNADGAAQTVVNTVDYYTNTGLVKSYTKGNGHIIQLQYDKLDRLTKVTNPDATVASVVYTDSANQAVITDESGIVTRMRWDRLGNVIEEAIREGSAYRILRSYEYDTYGRLDWERDNANRMTDYDYDAWSRIIKTTYPDNSYATVQYDDINRQVTSTDPEGNRARSTSDVLERIIRSEMWRGGQYQQLESMTYNREGNVLTRTNAAGTTTYTYDVLGRMKSVTDAQQKKYRYSYALSGPMTTVMYPDGNQIQKQYDERGRLIKQTNELGQIDKYYYDANGNVIQHIDQKGQSFTYTYNNRDFLTKKQSPDETLVFTYDPSGRRKTMSDSIGITSYEYKAATGELLRIVLPDNRDIRYTYNTLGQRTNMTDPFGYAITYTYDNRNRLTTVGESANNSDATYTYYKNNLMREIQLGNGNTSSFAYDGLQLSGLIHKKANGTLLHSFQYAYDDNGNITSQSGNQAGAAFQYQYSYDSLNRITNSSQFNETYTYDTRDNRATIQADRGFEDIFLFDKQYEYDSQNRLIKATVEGAEVTYRYNGDGLLYERVEGNQKTRYYYDGDQVIAEGSVSGTGNGATFKTRYVRGQGLAAQQSTSGKAYYLYNGHGDVIELRDSTGNTALNSYTYNIWGKPLIEQETVDNSFRYSGELWDRTTQLQYLRARWYDPSVGRFISKDTYEGEITNPLSLNLYTYTANNPLRYIDPSGHCFTEWLGKKYCKAAWESVKEQAKIEWEFLKQAHSSYYAAADYWSMGTLSELNEYYRISKENPYSLEQFLAAGMIFIEVTPQGKVGKLTNKGQDFLKNAIKACNCFTAGTKVLTDEGEKPIEEIKVGDKVLAKDDETGEMAYKEVEWLFQRDVEETYNITVGEEVITTTDEHPFWIVGKGWVESKNLAVGDVLTTTDGKELAIEKIEVKKEHVTVYNFKVKDFHTYFVSNLGIWTHNACGVHKWGNPKTLQDHYDRHGADFGVKTPDAYAKKANDFFNDRKKYQIKTDTDGTIRVYDSKTNTFGSYNADGTTKTFYKPASPTYWNRQPGK
ncbi:polymorphic toxin-type HINT domain-containing protein [Paenibacillus sp. GCM10012307]|uniref:polymorphic toxin-type HINT domain-containing protein n=1 Tax=Paenibacillus sp. GCM10012307 TaxID=3317343 RepID=UPI003608BBAC